MNTFSSSKPDYGQLSLGLKITLFPASNTGSNPLKAIHIGKLNGLIFNIHPNG